MESFPAPRSRWEEWRQCRGASAKPRRSLVGKAPSPQAFHVAAEAALAGARPLSQNGFKIDLGKHSVVRTLTLARVALKLTRDSEIGGEFSASSAKAHFWNR